MKKGTGWSKRSALLSTGNQARGMRMTLIHSSPQQVAGQHDAGNA